MVRAFRPAAVALLALLTLPARAGVPPAKAAPADALASLDPDPESLPTPPGSKADQAIWAGALEASFLYASERGQGRQLLWRAVGGRFDETLATRAAGEGEDAKRAAALRKRLTEAYGGVYRAATTLWGVDARLGCRAQSIDLDGAMRASGGRETHDLHEAREHAQSCTAMARRGAGETRRANEALRAVLDEALAFLVPAAPAEAATPTTTPAAAPAAAAPAAGK